jgi:hypothetical protein
MGYRILSMDGGGSWALIHARTLIELYSANTTGHEVLADFDLVVGNSGGSMMLAGLVEDLTLKEVLAYFEDEKMRRMLFSPTKTWYNRLSNTLIGLGPKYSTENKLAALKSHLPKTGAKTLYEAARGLGRRAASGTDIHLLIIGFDYDANRAAFFRSRPTKGPGWGEGHQSGVALAEAVHASTNAPVNYFDTPALLEGGGRYWDGGITGCNNPVLAGVTEAIGQGQVQTDIVALSIGTGTVALPVRDPAKDAPDSPFVQPPTRTGFFADLRRLATSIMDDPPDVATFLAHVMTGGGQGLNRSVPSRVVRLNPLISPVGAAGTWRPPGQMTTQQFIDMVKLDVDAIEQELVDKIIDYTKRWIAGEAPNQPIRADSDTLVPELGDTQFKQAVGTWQTLKNSY